ncbi:MAG: tetratricopeptide repeat protein [Chloroflexota bacterium]|nr:tetratricopeptide repeat protein [Chloroflexota bacterium]
MASLSLSLLGSFNAVMDCSSGTPVPVSFRTRKEAALLAYLAASAGEWQPRSQLAEMLWPEQPQSAAGNSFRQALFRINRSIKVSCPTTPKFIETNRSAVRLAPEYGVWLDTAAFEAHLGAVQGHDHERLEDCPTCMGHLQDAVALYRGEFLAGMALKDSSDFDIWLMVNREHYLQKQLEISTMLSEALHQAGDLPTALYYAKKQVSLVPLEETGYRQLMTLLSASGQRGAALGQFEICRHLLVEELGSEPGAQTVALYEGIKAEGYRRIKDLGKRARDKSYPSSLPVQLTPFIGRTSEIAQVIRHLDNPDCRLLTLTGPGGVGKTRLAVEAALGRRSVFTEGLWFVPMAAVPPESPVDVLAAHIGSVLGVSLQKGADIQDRLLEYLADREMLLIIDNFEHLLESASLLIEILKNAPGVKLLVTTRERLGYQAEHLLDLDGLPYPTSSTPGEDVEPPGDTPAFQLFVERARRAKGGFAVDVGNCSHITRICQLVEGIPLAIELAAAQVRTHPCAQIAQQIASNLDSLSVQLLDIPKRQRSLQAVFEGSWGILSEAERQVFVQLAVFRGGFTFKAAQAVTGITRPLLEGLGAKSLLRRSGPDRYDLHKLLQQYATEKLAETSNGEGPASNKHSNYYLTMVQERHAPVDREKALSAMETITDELANIRAAWTWAVEQDRSEILAESIIPLSELFQLVELYREGESAFHFAVEHFANTNGLEISDIEDTRASIFASVSVQWARFLFILGRFSQVIQIAQRAADLAHSTGDTLCEARALSLLGAGLRSCGDSQTAQSQLERALDLVRLESVSPKDPAWMYCTVEVNILNRLGLIYLSSGDREKGGRILRQALDIADRMRCWQEQAMMLGNLGSYSSQGGNFDKAIDYFQRSMNVATRTSRRIHLNNLGSAYLKLGDYSEAKSCYEKALLHNRECGARKSETYSLGNLGLLHHYTGDDETALIYTQQALEIAQEIGDLRAHGYMWLKLGHALAGLGQLEEAVKAYRESVTVRRDLGNLQPMAESLAGLARVTMLQAKNSTAQEYVEEILQITGDCEKLEHMIDPFLACLTCIQVLQASGDRRAPEILRHAHNQLYARAEKISDERLRHSYLENVPNHRELVNTSLD